ncbi:glycosyltransferase family 2 protein [bacterium]|nr:glycosyltransferase family 2 protein [bacterium]
MGLELSIIIPTFNRPDTLALVLDSYAIQYGLKEIIIVDDASTLSYEKTLEGFKQKYPALSIVYHKNTKNMGAGASRNIGLSIAKGNYILWGEDDAFLSDDYSFVLFNKIQGEKKACFGSIFYGILPAMDKNEVDSAIQIQSKINKPVFDYRTLEGYYRFKNIDDSFVPWGHALIMVPREGYENVTYFEGYKVNGYREETDAQVQLIKEGYMIQYTSHTSCFHFPSINKNGGQHSKNRFKYEYYKIKNNNLFLKRHFSFLKRQYQLKGTRKSYEFRFMLFVFKELFRGFKRRISRTFKKGDL